MCTSSLSPTVGSEFGCVVRMANLVVSAAAVPDAATRTNVLAISVQKNLDCIIAPLGDDAPLQRRSPGTTTAQSLANEDSPRYERCTPLARLSHRSPKAGIVRGPQQPITQQKPLSVPSASVHGGCLDILGRSKLRFAGAKNRSLSMSILLEGLGAGCG